MDNIIIRQMKIEEATAVSDMVRRVLLEVNAKDYEQSYIEEYAVGYGPEHVLENVDDGGRVYIALLEDEIVGCGAVVPYKEEEDCCIIQTFFIRPDMEFKGIGTKIMKVLESDEIFTGAKKALVSSSITAPEFYIKMGFDYKDGVKLLEEEDHYWMEKYIR